MNNPTSTDRGGAIQHNLSATTASLLGSRHRPTCHFEARLLHDRLATGELERTIGAVKTARQ
jgi:hypothetical protein